jgi:AmmeMemoRadiSam system protein A
MSNVKIGNEDVILTDEEKKNLLLLARKSMTHYLQTEEEATSDELGVPISSGMSQIMGAFVTLHKNGSLRGCIGEITPRRELYKAVLAHSVNSAVRDHRFNPVSSDELSDIELEISALTPSRQIHSHKEIEIGKHGVVFTKGYYSSVFLPQVAPEQGWDVEETLSHLAMKAGLPANAWKEGAELMVFEAIVFSE